MGQSADQIRREIENNRDSAAQKIDQLQSQVQGTAEELRTGVQDTADQVISQVKGTVDQTVESVKESMDIRQYIEQRPLLSLGVALVGGFVLGGVTGGGNGQQHRSHYSGGYPQSGYSYSGTPYAGSPNTGQYTPGGSSHQSSAMSNGVRAAIQKTGLEETVSNAAAALIGSLTDQLKTTLDQNIPGFAEKMDSVRKSDGDFASKAKEAQSSSTL
jgi:ElaB/YqjD/DUF883 family membrane-anchored ribosome-binding protein